MKTTEKGWKVEFTNNAIYRMEESLRMVKKCLEELDEADLWKRPNESSNSVANLILHLCGNITQYIISSLGGLPDTRIRDLEFGMDGGASKTDLSDQLEAVIEESGKVIKYIDAIELLRVREVQGFRLSGIGVVIHVVEHFSYHTGQIAYWTKLLKDKDLGFYEGLDLNIKNRG